MKKNLRNVLALALGLMTTVSFAQDWNVDSRTRMDMSEAYGSEDYRVTTQRVTLGATWGGSDWGIHMSSDFHYSLGDRKVFYGSGHYGTDRPIAAVYEAYASANMFGMASMTVGRQALEFGSGNLVGINDWGYDRNTWDGMSFGLDLDMADVTLGYATRNDGGFGVDETGTLVAGTDAVNGAYGKELTDNLTSMYLNANGEFSGWNVNVLYLTTSILDDAAYGIDLSGGIMGASVSASLNEDFAGNSMRMFDLGYAVNDNLSLNVGQTAYGDDGDFNTGSTGLLAGNMGDGISGSSWATHGNIGFLGAGKENLHYGLTYTMGGISISATGMRITDSDNSDDVAGVYLSDDYDRQAMELGLSYSLGSNASLGLKYVTDEVKNDGAGNEGGENKFTWVTLTVTP